MEQIDGLTLWKNILNNYKNNVSPTFYKTFFENDAVQYYDFLDNTIFLKCIKPFIKENLEKQIDDIYKVMKDTMNIENIKIKPIINGSEVRDMFATYSATPEDNILEKYTFESFVTGGSNNFAHASCMLISESPSFISLDNKSNPAFLYGGVGLGKTHLMHATANRIKEKFPNCKVAYVPSEKFTNELITALKNNKQQEFRDKYRSLDVLLIDDIQFIIGKESTQEEFFNTFNELRDANKQIIISSDRSPKEFTTLEDRLKSRFDCGLPIDIQPPVFETRVAILQKKCESENIKVPEEIIVLIANSIQSNIRKLEGALNKVYTYSSLMNVPLTYDLAKDILKDMIESNEERRINSDYIKKIVGSEFNVKYDDFSSSKRSKNIAYPRQIAMYLCKETLDMSLSKIGDEFGGKDHTTVIHACKKISDDIENKKDDINIVIEKLINQIKS